MTTSPYGRALVQWPDLGSPAGAPLHAEVTNGISFLSNNLVGRWSGSQPITASGSFLFTHNFDLALTSLRVRLFEAGVELSEAQVTAGFTIVQTSIDAITITNTGGVSRTIEVYVFPLTKSRKADLDADFSAMVKLLSTQGHLDTSTGGAATLATVPTSYKMVTSASLTGIAGIIAQTEHTLLLLTNETGASISVLNESASAVTASARILTGTGATLALANDASLLLAYDVSSSRWRIVGGSGGGGYASSAQVALGAAGTVTGVTSGFNKIRVAGASAAVTLSTTPFGTSAPLDGTEVVLVGGSNTNTVSLTASDIAKGFAGNGDVELFKGSTLTAIYDATLDRWLEKARNIISIA